jgi:glycosyltransferase involved in cell wall biosynthesis
MKLTSVIIPVYNEENTVQEILDKVNHIRKNINLEIIVVNDGSTDRTPEILNSNKHLIDNLINNEQNSGKGYAIKKGLVCAKGEYIFFQDADNEYEPSNLIKFIEIMEKYNCDFLMGSRFISENRSVIHFWHMLGNKFITFVFNLLNDTTFTDIYCCHCLFKRDLLNAQKLKSKGWGQQAEILSHIVKKSKKNYETSVNYYARSYSEGKKIRYFHVFEVLYWIFFTKFFS